ncbi:hypothetical protein BDN70DRAFT_693538 [Pholiota conissans]|uniref:Uncharacterized protein n=1 Tax=Pholiota conissans TaxID=109636 RepID=A0A9P6CTJ0_9AGAR|nr:hypothetical protein BDN70DRAFT_693538 [Pholiota conissans]
MLTKSNTQILSILSCHASPCSFLYLRKMNESRCYLPPTVIINMGDDCMTNHFLVRFFALRKDYAPCAEDGSGGLWFAGLHTWGYVPYELKVRKLFCSFMGRRSWRICFWM